MLRRNDHADARFQKAFAKRFKHVVGEREHRIAGGESRRFKKVRCEQRGSFRRARKVRVMTVRRERITHLPRAQEPRPDKVAHRAGGRRVGEG